MIDILEGYTNRKTLDEGNMDLLRRNLIGYKVNIVILDPIEPTADLFPEIATQIESKYFEHWRRFDDGSSMMECYLLAYADQDEMDIFENGRDLYVAVLLKENRIVDWSRVRIGVTLPSTHHRSVNLNVFGFHGRTSERNGLLSSKRIFVRIVGGGNGNHHYLVNQFNNFSGAAAFHYFRNRRKMLEQRDQVQERIAQLRQARRVNGGFPTEYQYWKEVEYRDQLRQISYELFPMDSYRDTDLEMFWFNNVRQGIVEEKIVFRDWNTPVLMMPYYKLDRVSPENIRVNDVFLSVAELYRSPSSDANYELKLYRCHSPIKTDKLTPYVGLDKQALNETCEVIQSLTINID